MGKLLLTKKWVNWGVILLAGVMTLPLLMHALTGRYLRPVADDFCIDARLQSGYFSALKFWFTEWEGRYLLILVRNSVIAAPSLALHLAPGIVLLLWAMSGVFLWYQAASVLGVEKPFSTAAFVTLALMFATTEIAPNLEQSLYWISGMPAYALPIPFVTFYAGIAVYAFRKNLSGRALWFLVMLGALVLYPAGGGAESHLAFHLTLLVVLLAATLRFLDGQRRRIALIFIGTGLLVTFLSTLTVWFAPGTDVRRSVESHDLSIVDVTLRSFGYTAYTNAIQVNPEHPRRIIAIGFLFLAAFALAYARGRRLDLSIRSALGWLAASGVVTFVLMWSTIFTGYYGLGKALPERARFHTLSILMVALLMVGFAAGCWLKSRDFRQRPLLMKAAVAALMVFTLLGPLRSAYNTLNRYDDFRVFADEWDARDAHIRAERDAGSLEVVVQPMAVSVRDVFRLGTIVDNPSYWINVCVADSYGVESIVDPQTVDPDQFEDES